MSRSSDTVIERAMVREVASVFRSRETLDAAVDDLLLAGFDRADIDVAAGVDALRERLGGAYVDVKELADVPVAPRRPFIAPEDVTLTVALAGSVIGFVAAGLVAFAVMASGGTGATAAVGAIPAGLVAGGIGAALVARHFRELKDKETITQVVLGGLVLWVRVRSPEQEDKAQQILREHQAEAIRVHEVPIEKRSEDLPLGSLRPDPWLGNERLGQP